MPRTARAIETGNRRDRRGQGGRGRGRRHRGRRHKGRRHKGRRHRGRRHRGRRGMGTWNLHAGRRGSTVFDAELASSELGVEDRRSELAEVGSTVFDPEALFEPEHEAEPQSRRELAEVGGRPVRREGRQAERTRVALLCEQRMRARLSRHRPRHQARPGRHGGRPVRGLGWDLLSGMLTAGRAYRVGSGRRRVRGAAVWRHGSGCRRPEPGPAAGVCVRAAENPGRRSAG